MSVADLRAQVNERVQEALVPVLFERAHRLHQKWEWRTCQCSFCQEKRRFHASMQYSPRYMTCDDRELWREGRRAHTRHALAEKAKIIVSY